MEIAREPYCMAYIGLIHAKKRRRKSHAWAPLSRPGITGYIFHIITFNQVTIIHILAEVVLAPTINKISP